MITLKSLQRTKRKGRGTDARGQGERQIRSKLSQLIVSLWTLALPSEMGRACWCQADTILEYPNPRHEPYFIFFNAC